MKFIDRLPWSVERIGLIRVFWFPLVWTVVWFLWGFISPLGSWFSFAYIAQYFDPLKQTASLGGLSIINFIIALSVSISIEVYSQVVTIQERFFPKKSALVGLIFITFMLIYGSFSRLCFYGFFQRDIENFGIENSFNVACLINEDATPGYMLNHTRKVAPYSNLIMWSEEAANVYSQAELEAMYADAKDIAKAFSVYVAVAYEWFNAIPDSHKKKNMLTLIDPNGEIRFEYQKAYPVFIGEADVQPGPKVIPYIDDGKLGRIGGAICFDFDFPQYIAQAGSQNVDIMLQPSNTWGTIGYLHSVMDSFRAVEQGFTSVRCDFEGISGVYSPLGDVYSQDMTLEVGEFLTTIPIGLSRRTPYSIVGDAFAYFCCCLLGFSVGALIWAKRHGQMQPSLAYESLHSY